MIMFETLKIGEITFCEVANYPYKLQWLDQIGVGYLKSDGYEYGESYWKHYLECSHSLFGEKLTKLRAEFIIESGVSFDDVCDVGVGSGQFVEFVKCKGIDINVLAIKWLKEHNYFADDVSKFSTLTLWDVIEHIDDPRELLKNTENLFISTPIYKDLQACLKSKHFKPAEHIWYFTDDGIKYYMNQLGYTLQNESKFETELGRDNIFSYYFKRT